MVAGDLALLFVCKLVCVCVHLALDVLRERIDVFGGPVGGSRCSILLFHLLLMEKRGERERSHKQNRAKEPVSLMKCVCMFACCVCMGLLYVFGSAMIALGSSHSFSNAFLLHPCVRGNEDQASVVA